MKHFIGTTLNYFIHVRASLCVCEFSTKRATRGILAPASCQEEHAENSMAFGEAVPVMAAAAAAHISLIRTIVPLRYFDAVSE